MRDVDLPREGYCDLNVRVVVLGSLISIRSAGDELGPTFPEVSSGSRTLWEGRVLEFSGCLQRTRKTRLFMVFLKNTCRRHEPCFLHVMNLLRVDAARRIVFSDNPRTHRWLTRGSELESKQWSYRIKTSMSREVEAMTWTLGHFWDCRKSVNIFLAPGHTLWIPFWCGSHQGAFGAPWIYYTFNSTCGCALISNKSHRPWEEKTSRSDKEVFLWLEQL